MPRPFGPRLRRLRLAAGLTRAELARRLDVTGPRVSHLEADTYGTPTLDLTIKIARALGVDPSELDGRLAATTKGKT